MLKVMRMERSSDVTNESGEDAEQSSTMHVHVYRVGGAGAGRTIIGENYH